MNNRPLPKYLYKRVTKRLPGQSPGPAPMYTTVHKLTWLGWLYFAPTRVYRAVRDALWLV